MIIAMKTAVTATMIIKIVAAMLAMTARAELMARSANVFRGSNAMCGLILWIASIAMAMAGA